MSCALVLEFLLCVSVFLQTAGSEDCNVVFQSKLNATMKCFTTYGDCGFDNLQARFPKLYNKTGWKREPPKEEDIKPSSFCEPDSMGVNQSGLHVQWKMPDSYNAEGIAGYEFHLELDPPMFRCLVVTLHEKPTQFNRHFSLNVTIYPVSRHHNYMIVLHTLPRANDSISSHKSVMSMNCKRGSPSADWTPASYNWSYDQSKKFLTVWFPAPPLEYNISKFKLDLFPVKGNHTSITTTTTEVTFKNQETGEYKLYMKPYDDYPYEEDRCVCRNDEGVCKHCRLNVWKFEIPKKISAQQPKDYLQDVLVGLAVFVAVAIVLVILYKILAKHFGIECVFGNSKNNDGADFLHVLCIDVNSSREDLSKFRFILENDLKVQPKLIRIIGISEKKASSKVTSLFNQQKHPSLFSYKRKSYVHETSDSPNKENDAISVLICLLISDFSDENLSECLSIVRAGLPPTRRLIVQICAVTFGDKIPFHQFKTALKCYYMNKGKQDFVSAVKNAFPKHTMDHNRSTSVVYTSYGKILNDTGKNGIKSDLSNGQYIALSKSKSSNDSYSQNKKDMEALQTFVPEVMFLGASEPRRERYISNDSGRGTSVLSYKLGHSPEDRNPLWEDATTISSTVHHQQFPSANHNVSIYRPHLIGTECTSCDISFFPPDPSVISENSFDPHDIDLDGFYDLEGAPQQFNDIKCQNCLNGVAKPCASSIDSLMDKMAEINKRNETRHDPCLGEVHSVWEGHV